VRALEAEPVTCYALMACFANRLQCEDALYLDGISTSRSSETPRPANRNSIGILWESWRCRCRVDHPSAGPSFLRSGLVLLEACVSVAPNRGRRELG